MRIVVILGALAMLVASDGAAQIREDQFEDPIFHNTSPAEARLLLQIDNALDNDRDLVVRGLRVTIEDDVATVIGTVNTLDQAERALETVSEVRGVSEVRNLIAIDPDRPLFGE